MLNRTERRGFYPILTRTCSKSIFLSPCMCCMASAMSDLLKPHWSKNSSCQRVIAAGALTTGGLAQWFVARSCSTLSPVSAGMDDRIRAGIPPRYVTKPTRSTQRCIPLGSLNRVPALIGCGKGGNVTSAGWQVILCALFYENALIDDENAFA